MSRRIVQISAVITRSAPDGADLFDALYALDQNGVAWAMENPTHTRARWLRLPELPSIDTRPPAPGAQAPTSIGEVAS